jgi:hypothetical protein
MEFHHDHIFVGSCRAYIRITYAMGIDRKRRLSLIRRGFTNLTTFFEVMRSHYDSWNRGYTDECTFTE